MTRNGFNYIHMYMNKCKTYIYSYRFEQHDRIPNKMIIRFC